jgi:hypothetical protein
MASMASMVKYLISFHSVCYGIIHYMIVEELQVFVVFNVLYQDLRELNSTVESWQCCDTAWSRLF